MFSSETVHFRLERQLSFDGLDDQTCDANMKPAVVDYETCGEPTRVFWLAIEKQLDTDDRGCDERQW